MKLYYKKYEQSFEINVKDANSDFVLETGNNYRLRYKYKNEDIFYATICKFYDGIWYINSSHNNFFSYIKSAEIEKRKELSKKESLYSWGKYFIKELENINFFNDGIWHMDFYIPNQKQKKFLSLGNTHTIFDFEKTFDFKTCRYLDWYGEDNGMILNTKDEEEEDSARVKYFRKKVREDSLPPILLQFIPSLDSFIILDGHCRYKASLLENVLPNLVVIGGVRKIIVKEDENRKKKVLEQIKKNQESADSSKKMNVSKINDLLINLYGNKEFYTSYFIGKAVYDFNKKWEDIIKNKLGKYEELPNILNREE
ncbi:hypothetical protein CRV00_02980 [Malaciobacter molluscorum]|uniref:hypothetical protein n=1 Tax=Malaciobacter molluscorum TaxID=1032072 RepID=UPI00100BE33F|nr:hypothetical protein [Malaciobacter molluscorum]RXJ96162.1 hypothetical protein CRV00_02980 [Malaciobacter molluscorum]